jgi:tRNA(Ile)-lysidine synthase
LLRRSKLWRWVSDGLDKNDRILVAVSGGPDSIALLNLVLPEEKDLQDRIVVAHIHHGTGDFADSSSKFVRECAETFGLEYHQTDLTLDSKTVKDYGFEATARDARYEALEKIGEESGCIRYLTAHSRDDQSESVLMALMRGGGATSLSGVRYKRGRWMRPLLDIGRDDLLSFLEREDIVYLSDPMNDSEQFTRVKVRKNLKKVIVENFGQGSWNNIARTADKMASIDDTLTAQSELVFNEVVCKSINGWISIDAEALGKYFADIQERIYKMAYFHAAWQIDKPHLTRAEIRKLHSLFDSKKAGFRLELPSVLVYNSDKRVIFNGHEFDEPKIVKLENSNFQLDDGSFIEIKRVAKEDIDNSKSVPGKVERFDGESLGQSLTFRPWHRGDCFEPLGKPGRSVKVTRSLRNPPGKRIGPLWIMEAESGTIAYIPGERIADSFKVNENSKFVWSIIFSPPEV